MEQAAQLGSDELQCILRKLSFFDVLRLKRVCRWWRSVAESYASSPSYRRRFQAPWLVLPENGKKGECRLSLFNLNEKKVHRDVYKIEVDKQGQCVGCSHGWLVLLDESANLRIFNPFSCDGYIEVGLLGKGLKFTKYDAFIVKKVPRKVVHKAVVMSGSRFMNKDKDGVVVLIYGSESKKLAFFSPRDGRFTDLEGAHPPYHDITCNHDKVVCALSETGSVEVWDFNIGAFPAKMMDMTPPRLLNMGLVSVGNFGAYRIEKLLLYLVESGGELLLIARLIAKSVKGFERRFLPVPHKTLLFHVYRLDPEEKEWVRIESLGDRVVFLGGNESMSLSVGDCPGCVENSIYFTNDDRWFDVEDVGFYNLEDKRVKPLDENSNNHRYMRKPPPPVPFWILPNPW